MIKLYFHALLASAGALATSYIYQYFIHGNTISKTLLVASVTPIFAAFILTLAVYRFHIVRRAHLSRPERYVVFWWVTSIIVILVSMYVTKSESSSSWAIDVFAVLLIMQFRYAVKFVFEGFVADGETEVNWSYFDNLVYFVESSIVFVSVTWSLILIFVTWFLFRLLHLLFYMWNMTSVLGKSKASAAKKATTSTQSASPGISGMRDVNLLFLKIGVNMFVALLVVILVRL